MPQEFPMPFPLPWRWRAMAEDFEGGAGKRGQVGGAVSVKLGRIRFLKQLLGKPAREGIRWLIG